MKTTTFREELLEKLKDEMEIIIGGFEVPADEMVKDAEFTSSFLYELRSETLPDSELESMVDCLEFNGYTVIKVTNLATQNKVENFIEELKQNPY